jgi:CheY-like chemotaxis protein
MNLATNSAHAMPRGGRLELVAAPLYVRDSVARANPGLREGAYVALEVRDSGMGMRGETLRRAFEPFFTTKPTGEGTGLGLAMVHGIMHEHDGAVQLESEVGVGTVVRCLFPAIDAPERQSDNPTAADPPQGAGQLVMLVDDEPSLLVVGRRRLETLGYRVRTASSPHEAITIFSDDSFQPQLLISDYSMPGMSGLELCTEISQMRPGLPMILLTGFIADIAPDVLRTTGVCAVLRKPITLLELAESCSTTLKVAKTPT